MANIVGASVGSVLTKIEFKDDDFVLGYIRINLTDARIVERMEKCAEFFRDFKPEGEGIQKLRAMDNAIIERFNYLLGYDCESTLFGVVSPTTITDSGDFFALTVLSRISEVFQDEIKRKVEARANAIKKHTAKYNR